MGKMGKMGKTEKMAKMEKMVKTEGMGEMEGMEVPVGGVEEMAVTAAMGGAMKVHRLMPRQNKPMKMNRLTNGNTKSSKTSADSSYPPLFPNFRTPSITYAWSLVSKVFPVT
jgi:hypothetical protein